MMNSVHLRDSKGDFGFGQSPIPEPEANEVQIQVAAAPINPSDIYLMKGMFGQAAPAYPFTPGWEGAGTVTKAGEGEKAQSLMGKRVCFIKDNSKGLFKLGGSHAAFCVTSANTAWPIPDVLPFEKAASCWVNPMTALCLVDRIKELGGTNVIVTAAASQLGRMILRLCKNEGINAICTVRKADQAAMLKQEFGVEHVFDTSTETWQQEMGALAMQLKPTVCLECVAGDMTGTMMNFLWMGGVCILYGLLSEQAAGNINVLPFLAKNLKVEAFFLGPNLMVLSPEKQASLYARCMELLTSGELQSTVQKEFGLHEVRQAVALYKANQTAGKVLLKPDLTPAGAEEAKEAE